MLYRTLVGTGRFKAYIPIYSIYAALTPAPVLMQYSTVMALPISLTPISMFVLSVIRLLL